MRIGNRIQILRKAAGLTQTELAERLGVSFQTISGWERDEFLPDSIRLPELASALNTYVSSFFQEEDMPEWELHDRIFSEEHMCTFVKASVTALGYHQSARAFTFAREKHEGQLRKGAECVPYINHPLTMACHALAMNMEDDIVAAVLLHDVCEDCGVKPDELPVEPRVREAVRLLSFCVECGEDKAQAKARYYADIARNPIASVAKAIDRCNNVSTMASGFSREKMIEYIIETEQYVLPLLENIKNTWPEYCNAVFLLKYHLRSLLETLKRTII